MALTYRFQFPLPNGLHARPASLLCEVARRFTSAISLKNETRGINADAKSVLSMVAADVQKDHACLLQVDGPDEQAAYDALTKFIIKTLPTSDEPLPDVAAESSELQIPRSLSAAGLGEYLRGRPVCGGVAVGVAIPVRSISLPKSIRRMKQLSPKEELAAFRRALQHVSLQITANAKQAGSANEADVLDVHRSLLNDPELAGKVETQIQTGDMSAAQAVLEVGQQLIRSLKKSTSVYLRERVLDLEDVLMQLLRALGHAEESHGTIKLTAPSICVADHLTPSQFLSMDRKLLKGLILGQGGTTSHTIILARSRGIPTLVDAKESVTRLHADEEIVLDAELGIVIPSISDPVSRYYDLELDRFERMRQRSSRSQQQRAAPIGGDTIEIATNIISAEEVDDVCAQGADGIGLFRTEMLFLGRSEAPSEEEQFAAYTKALTDAAGKPVIIRTFDIGGDKPAPYLKLPQEANPFLGNRGVRLYESLGTLLKHQLRAMLRASSAGNLKILVPMVSCVEEVRAFKLKLDEARDELIDEGLTDLQMPPLGVMIEVPAAAMIVSQLAREVDFFSIGSNDLTQYVLAADREHPALSSLSTWTHPSLWKLLTLICDDARSAGKWIGLCGELGGTVEALPLLVALGLNEISVPLSRVADVKRKLRSLQMSSCEDLLRRVIDCATRDEVDAAIREHSTPLAKPTMLTTGLIQPESKAASKTEAIKELCDLVWLNDRTTDPKLLERAIWAREDTYSTGFGYGCAIPHCKSNALRTSTIAVAKLKKPVNWNADGTNPVDLMIMLALREQDHGKEHMRVLAQLSRMLMRDEFRDSLRKLNDPEALLSFLNQSLGL